MSVINGIQFSVRIHPVNDMGYDQNGQYFGVPYRHAGELRRVYVIEDAESIVDFVRAGSRSEAVALAKTVILRQAKIDALADGAVEIGALGSISI